MASCGAELNQANAAIDLTDDGENNTRGVPASVVDVWQQALHSAHGAGCVFKKKTSSRSGGGWEIRRWHLYKFVLA